MQTPSGISTLSTLNRAARMALQWRLLLLWAVALLIPTLIVALPLWQILATQLDHSVHAAAIAQSFQVSAMGDLLAALSQAGLAMTAAGILSFVFVLLASPFLSGMVISAARAPHALRFTALIKGGAHEYGRLSRLLFWSAVPLGIAIGLGAWAMHFANDHADKAILQSDATLFKNGALALLALLFAMAHTIADAARADFSLDTRRRSAILALWRGCKLCWRQPVATLGLYLGISAIGFGLAAALAFARINMPHVNVWGFFAALIITQLIVIVMAWMRSARLFALIVVARANRPLPTTL